MISLPIRVGVAGWPWVRASIGCWSHDKAALLSSHINLFKSKKESSNQQLLLVLSKKEEEEEERGGMTQEQK
jgi:hypothetical protein